MGTKIKPVQPTVIQDKKILAEVIAAVHRKPSKKARERMAKSRDILLKAMSK